MKQSENIEKWEHILDKDIHGPNHTTAIERLRTYIISLMMGRNFMEPADDYIKRAGHAEFMKWADGKLNIKQGAME